MNDLQIEYFLSVAENLSFSKTAKQLYVTQPAISKQIAAMEKELGVALFIRANRQILLTEAGKIMYKFYSEYRKEFRKMIHEAKKANETKFETIRIGYLERQTILSDVKELLNSFSREFPNTSVFIECMGIKDLPAALNNDSMDMIITIDHVIEEMNMVKGLRKELLAQYERVLFYTKNNLCAQKEHLSIDDFANETFITFQGQEKNIRNLLIGLYEKEPKIKVVNRIDSAFACVESGMGVMIGNSGSIYMDRQGILTLPIGISQDIILAIKDENRKYEAHLFVDKLCEMCQ